MNRTPRSLRRCLDLVRSAWQAKRDRRRDGDDPAIVGLDQLTAALVHEPVMPMAEQDGVGEIGRSALDPVHQAMSGPAAGTPYPPDAAPGAPSLRPYRSARNERYCRQR